ncbi:DUF3995 domain-containing protein [Ralstonia insidiosa]|jgi:hypothetical protein|uniref:Uncharacterized protein n=1 Tax=Ralstonia insidiosa TaxID=190721 RepID=A0A192A0V2_9RALS|nr:DUF3995 domain-containing protein [Ralstonia insidiosa]ANJ74080.1 hypothetical protein A9Y76_17210 [Ralstonia insidiosa]KAB0471296.1 DUF3995 domain-containing protein [Ralstonia insidiosa]MBY4909179.1 DUF3995 domain-containing protein [Ralstonia insidiosa]
MFLALVAGRIACAVLAFLGLTHLYWAAGGVAGKQAALPSVGGAPVFKPSAIGTASIAVILLAMAAWVAAAAGILAAPVPQGVLRVGAFVLAAIFVLRAVGDFRYVGFFKRVRGSVFARRDTWGYSPLCVVLAVLIVAAASR